MGVCYFSNFKLSGNERANKNKGNGYKNIITYVTARINLYLELYQSPKKICCVKSIYRS